MFTISVIAIADLVVTVVVVVINTTAATFATLTINAILTFKWGYSVS
jgi:hypothetical protein